MLNRTSFTIYICFAICFNLVFTHLGVSQTYIGQGGFIADDTNEHTFTVHVQNLNPSQIYVSGFGLESVCIEVIHPNVNDLHIILQAPDGTECMLVSNFGYGENFSTTCFNSNAILSVMAGNVPFNGIFRPMHPLGLVNNGQEGNGLWRLRITDKNSYAYEGTLIKWQITFGTSPSAVFYPDSVNVPIMVISTDYAPIPDEPKIHARMGIINNGSGNMNHTTDQFNAYDGYIAIEQRGSSSFFSPKKSFAFKTQNYSGVDINTNLLGLPSENEWILLGNFTDKTLIRNTLTFDLARSMGRWAPRSRFCELIINNDNKGLYVLTEKIKRDANRVNISKNETSDVSGGYIFKIDKSTGATSSGWYSNYQPVFAFYNQHTFFQYHYPKPEYITFEQEMYIQAYVDSFETALYYNYAYPQKDYYKFIDINSFIDFFIINEVAKNVDGYRLSTFLYKDKDSKNGKLVMGPVWDFDLAYNNADFCGGTSSSGWAYKYGETCPEDMSQPPFWWEKFLSDTVFTNKLNCRWNYLRHTILDTTYIYNYIDSVYAMINYAQMRNFMQWPIMGLSIWPNPVHVPQSYPEEISSLKDWFRNRLNWLDDNMPGYCNTVALSKTPEYQNFSIYPNPVNDYLIVDNSNGLLLKSYEIINTLGNVVSFGNFVENLALHQVNLLPHINSGHYFLKIYASEHVVAVKKLVVVRD